jgi:hypothetical protein
MLRCAAAAVIAACEEKWAVWRVHRWTKLDENKVVKESAI